MLAGRIVEGDGKGAGSPDLSAPVGMLGAPGRRLDTMTTQRTRPSPEPAALSDSDLCLAASFALAERDGDRVIGSDQDISDALVRGLTELGLRAESLSWQLSAAGTWYLSVVAEFSDRLATLKWATADSPYRFTPQGEEACRVEFESLRSRLGDAVMDRLKGAMQA